jgi:hypothetical protein
VHAGRFAWHGQIEDCTVKGAAHFDGVEGEGQSCRWRECKAMATAAEPGVLEVFAIEIGQGLANEPIAEVDVEAYRDFRVAWILCPTLNPVGRDPINIAPEG